ncbi:serine hydrolase [Pelagerythrobacter marensis]|uniref:Serine hydrolase n=1 Tax=Pelagerythrobacter marensis TaxID=543877 RepID=A0A0G3X7N1_9SPHN|nr:serine hydrolase [Pelagerythrobacter marensis]AKM06621.1 hypothetical protein AM2010_534 [Pelagerythrobacter marensis]
MTRILVAAAMALGAISGSVSPVLAQGAVFAAPTSREELRDQIFAADDILFERAFNECDLAALHDILLPDVEMYHDQAGINRGRDAFIAPVKANICHDGPAKPLRKRVDESIEIYPLYRDGHHYGAIQRGQHEFYIREHDKPLRLTNRARFTHVWLLTDEGWKLKTALSWDHLNPGENGRLEADVLAAGFDGRDEAEYALAAHGIQALSVAVVRDGVVSEVRSFGQASAERAAAADTIYGVASLSKPVSAMLALRLASLDLLDLDGPLAEFHVDPDIADHPWAARVTPRMVLSHTSGLPNWRYLDPDADSTLRFVSEPGTAYRYSGEGFEWLRQAIERKTGRSFESLAQEHVFQPAGMRDSSFMSPVGAGARVATRYDASGAPIATRPSQEANAGASLMTTAGDYARFLAFVMNGGGLGSRLAGEMFAPQVRVDAASAFGLGWQVLLDLADGSRAIQHTGSDPGIRALALGWPNANEGIVILSNSDNAMPLWELILKEEFGKNGQEIIDRNQ